MHVKPMVLTLSVVCVATCLKHQREQCIKLIGEMREELKTLTDILLNTPNMEQRTVGVGVLAKISLVTSVQLVQ